MEDSSVSLAKVISDLPDGDQPIIGWWDTLRISGTSIYARMAGLSKRLAGLARTKFPRRSMELRRESKDAPWDITGGVLLGAREPAIPLKDLDPDDTSEAIEDVEILRAGRWPAETGAFEVTTDDLQRTLERWQTNGCPRIPIVGIGGHDRDPAVKLARDGSETMTLTIEKKEELMSDELNAKLAANEQKTRELEIRLAAEEAARKADQVKLAAADKFRAETQVDAALLALRQPNSNGHAFPVPALDELRTVMLGMRDRGYVNLAAGDTVEAHLSNALKVLHTQGFVKAAPVLSAEPGDKGELKSPEEVKAARIQAEYDRMPEEERKLISFDSWKKVQ